MELVYFREYKTCLESEIQDKMMDLIGCIPPWFTDKYKQVSSGLLYSHNYLLSFLFSVVLSICHWRLNRKFRIPFLTSMKTFIHLSLNPACHLVKTLSIELFIEAMIQNQAENSYFYIYLLSCPGGYQMFLIFDQVVELYKSHLVIDNFTLFTRLGGEVGFCKEILWVHHPQWY